MGIISIDFSKKVEDQIRAYIKRKKNIQDFKLVQPIINVKAEIQRGETCKLQALAWAMEFSAQKHGVSRPPLYKDKQPFPASLRSIAKRWGSAVGEVYSLDLLALICKEAGFHPETYAPLPENYVETIVDLILRDKMPMVFFDLSLEPGREGMPYRGDGKNEHAATVVGYYRKRDGIVRFIVANWNNYYDFGAKALTKSTFSLADRRIAETFIKIIRNEDDKPEWILAPCGRKNDKNFKYLLGLAPRTAMGPFEVEEPLKGKLLVVGAPVSKLTKSRFMPFFSPPADETANTVAKSVRLTAIALPAAENKVKP